MKSLLARPSGGLSWTSPPVSGMLAVLVLGAPMSPEMIIPPAATKLN